MVMALVLPPLLWFGQASLAPAQTLAPGLRNDFLANPLKDQPRDSLLPNLLLPRPLSPLEKRALGQALDQLANQLVNLSAQDRSEVTIQLWLRWLRLSRLLGTDREIQALEQTVRQMRDWNATQPLQLLAVRLGLIVTDLDGTDAAYGARVEALARIAGLMGNLEAAVNLRRTLATLALNRGDRPGYQAQLETLANLYEEWFEFEKAAALYGELLQLVATKPNQADQTRFWQHRIDNLEQAQDLTAAIAAQQQLLTLYRQQEESWPRVAEVQTAMAKNYERLGSLNLASRQYQTAYTNAISAQQLDLAATILRHMAVLYQRQQRWSDVIYLEQQLLRVAQRASNTYGQMDSFDRLGQAYEHGGDIPLARQAYGQGLVLARILGVRQDYFQAQVNRLQP
ncbi:MAG: hypothetical protein LVS60_08430 [Nodosilinea sp. LVE1205-7]|jgi:tetratricopeptide (TPR) repeat protein